MRLGLDEKEIQDLGSEPEGEQEEDEYASRLGKKHEDPQDNRMSKEMAERIQEWVKNGLFEEDEFECLLESSPRIGKVNLEAPKLNKEIEALNLSYSMRTKDNYYVEYYNILGSSLTASASAMTMIMEERKVPIDREELLDCLTRSIKLQSVLMSKLSHARKAFLASRYDAASQKMMIKRESTEYIFGDELGKALDEVKTLEKSAKEAQPKPKTSFNKPQAKSSSRGGAYHLNYKSPPFTQEQERAGYRHFSQRSSYKRASSRSFSPTRNQDSRSRSGPRPAKRAYHQSQHQRSRR